MQVRKKISEGKDFIGTKKSIQDLENIVINLATLKKQLGDASIEGNETEASKFRNQYLQSAQRYIENVSDLAENFKQRIVETVPSSASPQVVETVPSSASPQVVETVPSSASPQVVETVPSSASPQVVETVPSSASPQVVETVPSSASPQVVETVPSSASISEIPTNVGKKAIVIGINKYQSLPDDKNLTGSRK